MASRKKQSGLPVQSFAMLSDWEAWLSAQPLSSKGLWLKLAKKASGVASVTRQEAIDGALCHGWIDGQLDRFDERYWLIRFTPRSSESRWSKVNRVRAQELMAQGRMRPGGLAAVERAKRNGSWAAAYAPQSKAVVPRDLRLALGRSPAAQRLFSQLDSRNRYAVLYRVHAAKKPETRAARIARYVEMLGDGQTLYPRRGQPAGPPRPRRDAERPA